MKWLRRMYIQFVFKNVELCEELRNIEDNLRTKRELLESINNMSEEDIFKNYHTVIGYMAETDCLLENKLKFVKLLEFRTKVAEAFLWIMR